MALSQRVANTEEIEATLLNAIPNGDANIAAFLFNLVAELGYRQHSLIVVTVAAVDDLFPLTQAYETYMKNQDLHENSDD